MSITAAPHDSLKPVPLPIQMKFTLAVSNMVFSSTLRKVTPPGESLPLSPAPQSGRVYRTTALLGKLSIVLSLLVVVALFSILFPKIAVLQRRSRKTVPNTRCVIYDRPPRTGSTTIATALTKCLASRGYKLAKVVNGVRSAVVRTMVSLETDRMAMVSSHVGISGDDLILLEENCGKLLYITGASPMKQRLYSALKYSLTSYHGNSTIERDMVDFATTREKKSKTREDFLEAYPHVTEDGTPLDVIPERIVPDYVIRKETLGEDLQAMLNALKCNTTIHSSNVHEATTEDREVFDTIKISAGDAMYKWLMKVSKDNEGGLRRAREF